MTRPSLVPFIVLFIVALCLLGPYLGVHIITTPARHDESLVVTGRGKTLERSHQTVDEIEDLLSQ